ncbi:MAG TPA: hypothetical protein VGD64_15935 [Acidisarcina sp.]
MEKQSKTELDTKGKTLLHYLVKKIPTVEVEIPSSFPTYSEVVEDLSLPAGRAGNVVQQNGMNTLVDWLKQNSLPAISGLIVTKAKSIPGEGFFSAYQRSPEDREWWKQEVRRVKEFDWSSVLLRFHSNESWTARGYN